MLVGPSKIFDAADTLKEVFPAKRVVGIHVSSSNMPDDGLLRLLTRPRDGDLVEFVLMLDPAFKSPVPRST